MSLNKFIEVINKPLESLISGIKVYGLAEAVTRTKGTVVETIPVVVGNDGEMKDVSPDDLDKVIIYHKFTGFASTFSSVIKGTGDAPNAMVNAYGASMIVWLNREKTNLKPEEFFLYIQANFPYHRKIDPYLQVLFRINNIILNGQTVFDSEFKGVEFFLPANQSLMQINYTIESTFHQKCFEKCPEEC